MRNENQVCEAWGQTRADRGGGRALMFKDDLSKRPAGQSGVEVYTGGENRGEEVREVNPGEGAVLV